MTFASKAFFIFLPIVLVGYHLLPTRAAKYRFLLAASYLFYAWGNPAYVWVILLTTAIDYWAGRLIAATECPHRRRLWLTISVCANLGLLFFFKYTIFFLQNGIALATGLGWSALDQSIQRFLDDGMAIARSLGWAKPDRGLELLLPLGISFHTFQGISYTLDVYRKKLPAVRSFVDFALFVAFFPQLVAGPIVRAVEFLPQMATPPRVTARQISEGLHFCLRGLFKKVFIADRLAEFFVDPVFADPGLYDAATLRWAVVAWAVQIYCDFSGYSDLAVGCAKWFGFELPLNFNLPFLAGSLTEFWKRWHITLSTWMRDYLYVSLGGSRRGNVRTYVNLILTMVLCGLWHGAAWNWALYGFYMGVMLALHRLYVRSVDGVPALDRLRAHPAYRLFTVGATLWLLAVALVLVRMESWAGCYRFQAALLGLADGGRLHWLPVWVPALVGLVTLEHLYHGVRRPSWSVAALPSLLRAPLYVSAVALIVVLGPGVGKAFVYFQF